MCKLMMRAEAESPPVPPLTTAFRNNSKPVSVNARIKKEMKVNFINHVLCQMFTPLQSKFSTQADFVGTFQHKYCFGL